jgi:hypothetical protein
VDTASTRVTELLDDPQWTDAEPGRLRFGGRPVRSDRPLIMAIVNRTPDSFYDRGATYAAEEALAAVERAVAEGADIVDIGGVKAGPGRTVDVGEEIHRVVPFIGQLRARFPDVVISVDTWRHQVGPWPARRVPTCSMTRGRAQIRNWPEWPPSSVPDTSARTPAGSRRGRGHTGSATRTWCTTWSPS